jgi:hypothetical protein
MIRTQIYLTQQQHNRVKALGLKRKTSISSVIREAIDEKTAKSFSAKRANQNLNAGEWLLSQVAWAEKKEIKGPADLSSKMDEYLYGQ